MVVVVVALAGKVMRAVIYICLFVSGSLGIEGSGLGYGIGSAGLVVWSV